MNGPAALAKGWLLAAIEKLRNAQAAVIGARSENTDLQVHLKTARDAALNGASAHMRARTDLREGYDLAYAALIGSSNVGASAALVWLAKANQDLNDNYTKLLGIEKLIQEQITKAEGIVTDLQETSNSITGAISEFKAQVTILG